MPSPLEPLGVTLARALLDRAQRELTVLARRHAPADVLDAHRYRVDVAQRRLAAAWQAPRP